MLPLIVTVILNTNRRDDTLACLASLERNTYERHHVLVLDNASTDGSSEAIRAAYPAVTLVPLHENRGYAGNNNVGIAQAMALGADWVFVLNEDTVVDPQCLQQLAAYGEAHPEVGIIGPMVYHADEPDVIQSAGGQMDRLWKATHLAQNERDTRQFPGPHQVDWISGCAILVRRSVVEQVGALDERFFYYWEEVEWCVRASRAGWNIAHVPAAKLWHKGVQRNYRPKPAVAYYNTRNRLLLLWKHRAPLAAWIWALCQIGRTVTSYSIRPKWRDKRADRAAMLKGACDFVLGRWGQAHL